MVRSVPDMEHPWVGVRNLLWLHSATRPMDASDEQRAQSDVASAVDAQVGFSTFAKLDIS